MLGAGAAAFRGSATVIFGWSIFFNRLAGDVRLGVAYVTDAVAIAIGLVGVGNLDAVVGVVGEAVTVVIRNGSVATRAT